MIDRYTDEDHLREMETRYDRCYGDLMACECQDDIPALIAEVRRLREERDRWRDAATGAVRCIQQVAYNRGF